MLRSVEVFWKRRHPEVKLNASDVLSIPCPECHFARLHWDGVIWKSLVERTVSGAVSNGQIGLLCESCRIGIVFDVTDVTRPAFDLERIVRGNDVPENVSSIEPVDRDRLRELRNGIGSAVFATELRLFEMMVRETDTICWYSTAFQSLSGSAGYAIVRDGSIVATLTTIQS